MGQAVAELPDPLESGSPGEAQSADDLLSQLAGDEIDRLLTESSGETAPAGKSTPTAEPAPAKQSIENQSIEKQPTEKPPASGAVDLDAVLATAVADQKASTAERAALNETTVAASPAARPGVAKAVEHSAQIELGDSNRRLPIFLRPLEWLSSPLDPWPDQIREILGKVGLMTLINAVAVIAYVLLFRRHH